MVETIKFSEFTNSGDLEPNQVTVGLEGGTNARYSNPMPLLPSGSTGDRPAITPAIYYRLRFNTTLESYEYFSPVAGDWIQIEDSGDIADLIARLAAHTVGNGASMIGLLDQGIVTSKTVQDLADATILAQTDNGTLVNGVFLSALASGMIGVTTGTGAIHSRTHTGTANQITVSNGDGVSGNPTYSIPTTFIFPGTMEVGGMVFSSNTITAIGDINIVTPNFHLSNPLEVASGGTENNTALTNGQLWIGNTGNPPSIATLTAGTGISIINSAGGITINATGSGMATVVVSGTSQNCVANTQYIATNAAQTTFNLPNSFTQGDVVKIIGSDSNSGGWVLNPGVTDSLFYMTTLCTSITSAATIGQVMEVTGTNTDTTWMVTNTVGTVFTTAP